MRTVLFTRTSTLSFCADCQLYCAYYYEKFYAGGLGWVRLLVGWVQILKFSVGWVTWVRQLVGWVELGRKNEPTGNSVYMYVCL